MPDESTFLNGSISIGKKKYKISVSSLIAQQLIKGTDVVVINPLAHPENQT
ncbi:MAG TPA: hypothetical protein V6D16_08820 [Candidatus Obscuribacterales bacterium]